MAGTGYALDLLTPVRHVATELDRAAGAARSVGDMAGTYTHPHPGDISRIRQNEQCDTDRDALIWLIDQAITALGDQVAAEAGGFVLARPFDDLRYKRSKLVRLVATDDADAKRALKAVHNDLSEDRSFYVRVDGRKKEQRFKLHPFARAIPQLGEREFMEMAADVKAHGVKLPIVVFDGEVLDGRHRVAIASALDVPVRVSEFKGTDSEARDHVLSLNVHRRHLTSAQRGLIVRELLLPEAKAEAEKRMTQAPGKRQGEKSASAEMHEQTSGAKAAQIAADRSNGLANVRTVETMAPVDNAPETKERIRRGEIKTAAEAKREAEKETGIEAGEVGIVPRTAWRELGTALNHVRRATEAIVSGTKGPVTEDEIRGRIRDIRDALDRIDGLLGRTD